MIKKPTVFSYRDYVEAVEELERIRAVNKALENEVIRLRIELADMKGEMNVKEDYERKCS